MHDHDRGEEPELIGSAELSLTDMKTAEESGEPFRIVRGARDAGEIYVEECTVEQKEDEEQHVSAGEYPKHSDAPMIDDDEQQDLCQHQAAVQGLLSQGSDNIPSYH